MREQAMQKLRKKIYKGERGIGNNPKLNLASIYGLSSLYSLLC
ncbi:hypothetical protein [Helicobacter enhydrae]|nr:hypothetical protein [Helicobacter enhydrae]